MVVFFPCITYTRKWGILNVRNPFTQSQLRCLYGGRIPSGESDWEIYGLRSSQGIPTGLGLYHGAAYAILALTPGLFLVLARVA